MADQRKTASIKKLTEIKTGALSRGFALARVGFGAGARAASHAVGNLFSDEAEKGERLKSHLIAQMASLAGELGVLKGSLMKAGQMLSMMGEHFLPPEANAALKSLQSQSPPLEWAAIERVLRRQLTAERLAELEVDHEPLAAASLGQVHRATRKPMKGDGGRVIALKVQYPGVDQAIDGDIRAMKRLLSVSKLVPMGPRRAGYDELFKEVRQMLHQEVDYERELEATIEFRKAFADDARYVIPEVFAEYSSHRVLATSFEPGVAVDSPEVLALPQSRRNALGLAALELYFREVFELRAVQTDPHLGNYRVRLGASEAGTPGGDRLVLLDFGAVRRFPKKFTDPYFRLVRASIDGDRGGIVEAASELGFVREEDSEAMKTEFADVCRAVVSPFVAPYDRADGVPFDWRDSELPKRVARQGAGLAVSFRLRPPPREIVFLDRKMGGVFIFLSVLHVKLNARPSLDRWLPSG